MVLNQVTWCFILTQKDLDMKQNDEPNIAQRKWPRWKLIIPIQILLIMALLVTYCSKPQTPPVKTRYRRASSPTAFCKTNALSSATATPSPCPAMTAKQIYHYIAGTDPCPMPMSSSEVAAQLNDPYATSVLIPNVGGAECQRIRRKSNRPYRKATRPCRL